MSRGPRRSAAFGRTKAQHLCLVAARSGKLVKQARPYELVLQQPTGHFDPIRMFGKQAVKECEKAGWLTYLDRGDGSFRIITTPAGDAELCKPLKLKTRPYSSLQADLRREALR